MLYYNSVLCFVHEEHFIAMHFFITDNSYQLSMRFLAVLQIFEIECKIEISKMFATVPNIMRKEHMRYYAFPQN